MKLSQSILLLATISLSSLSIIAIPTQAETLIYGKTYFRDAWQSHGTNPLAYGKNDVYFGFNGYQIVSAYAYQTTGNLLGEVTELGIRKISGNSTSQTFQGGFKIGYSVSFSHLSLGPTVDYYGRITIDDKGGNSSSWLN